MSSAGDLLYVGKGEDLLPSYTSEETIIGILDKYKTDYVKNITQI